MTRLLDQRNPTERGHGDDLTFLLPTPEAKKTHSENAGRFSDSLLFSHSFPSLKQ